MTQLGYVRLLHVTYGVHWEWVTTRGHISSQKIMARWGGVSLIYMHVNFFLPYILIKRPILTTFLYLPVFFQHLVNQKSQSALQNTNHHQEYHLN